MKNPYNKGGGSSKFLPKTGAPDDKGKELKSKNVRVEKSKKVRKKI